MPLFHYNCKSCGQQSEILVRGGADPVCPACGAATLEKQASRFAALTSTHADPGCASGACGFDSPADCGMGGCCMN